MGDVSETVRLIGGPYDRLRVELARAPYVIVVGDHPYERIDDPDTGESLGAYYSTEAS